ncbi:MAG: GNAT family N-acetyltransferase [Actinomycetaceae bacterium]|nr:GNAT family N-acetyltransferase [Actinomycetaceae bacterium]
MTREPRNTVVLDTNIFIYAQDYASRGHPEEGRDAATVQRVLGELGYTPVIAEATLDELRRNKNGNLKACRLREAERYARVTPGPPGDLRQRAGYSDHPNPNDEFDLRILAALDQRLAAWIITNDKKMISHAARAGISHVLDAKQFLEFLEPARYPGTPTPPVSDVPPNTINIHSLFFTSLLKRYPEFYDWWQKKVVPEGRTTFVVGKPEDPQALAVLKENDTDYDLPQDTTKICTFKVSDDMRGRRYGELLLKTTIEYIRTIPSSTAFLEVAADNELVPWLRRFGFSILETAQAANGDQVMVKHLTGGGSRKHLSPWDYHIAYGPGALRVQRAFLVPIRPGWHDRLFPRNDALPLSLNEPCGNAITKVYISHSSTTKPARGDVLVFYESESGQQVSNIGIVEDVMVSSDPIEVLRFAGNRTVYTDKEVKAMCLEGEVHVMKFRHDRTLSRPWRPGLEGYDCLVKSPPRSITAVKGEGLKWLKQKLGE